MDGAITATLILVIMGGLLTWAEHHVGVTASISRLFYHNKTKKAFKAALWLAGSILVFHDLGDPLLTVSGLSLIAVPIFGDFENKKDLTKYLHFLFAGTFFLTTALYIGPWMVGLMSVGTIIGLLTIKRNKLYWLEVIGIISLISGFYII